MRHLVADSLSINIILFVERIITFPTACACAIHLGCARMFILHFICLGIFLK